MNGDSESFDAVSCAMVTELCARLEAPLLLHPDADFQSLDGISMEPSSWLEIPLRADRAIPFKCAVSIHVVDYGRTVFIMDPLGYIARPSHVLAVDFHSLLRRLHNTTAVTSHGPRNRRGRDYHRVPHSPGPYLLVATTFPQPHKLVYEFRRRVRRASHREAPPAASCRQERTARSQW